MAFWDEISAAQIRRESGLAPAQVREQSDLTMTASIAERIVENARFVRRKINDAAGEFSFGAEGFSPTTLAALFPAKVEDGGHLVEGEDILALAREAVRFRCLFDLESRNKNTGADVNGNSSNIARTYKANAEEREASIIGTLEKALASLHQAPQNPTRRSRPSQSVRLRATF